MKKLLLILLCVPLIGLGQHSLKFGLVFGGGLNDFNITTPPQIDMETSSSLHFNSLTGADMTYYFSDKMSINGKFLFQPIEYENLVLATNEDGFGGLGEFNFAHLDYLLFSPLVFQYHLGNNKNYFINAGFSVSYLINRIGHFTLVNDPEDDFLNDTYIADLDNVERINAGAVFGLGFLYPINKKINLNFDIAANYGFVFNNVFLMTYTNGTKFLLKSGEGHYVSYTSLLGISYNIKTK